MTQAIYDFLNERKELWLKDRLKKAVDEAEVNELTQQANQKFSLTEWIVDAAKRGTQLSMVSHPSKFSHPSAKTSSVIAQAQSENDGYLRTGNIDYPLDVFGNAAAMDVYKFLSIPLSNGLTVLENIEQKNELIQNILNHSSFDFEILREDFLKIKRSDLSLKTDHLVKQVYFPISKNEYHLLSLLTASGLITTLKKRLDDLRFSDATKAAKESRRKNEIDPVGYADIYDLTVTAYGGTQPQNVSVLNSQNAGRAYLLPSTPPKLEKRSIRLPNSDFFSQTLYRNNYKDSFTELHKFMRLDINNINIRNAIQNIIQFLIDQILLYAFKIRSHYEQGWSEQDYYIGLPKIQRIWLDNLYQDYREKHTDWRDEIAAAIGRWIILAYEKTIEKAYKLGDGELSHVKIIVTEQIKLDRENF